MNHKESANIRGKKIGVLCACGCGQKFMVRVADRKRGWGKYASKRCKAKHQESKTHASANYYAKQQDREDQWREGFTLTSADMSEESVQGAV